MSLVWSPWSNPAQGNTLAGSPITAVPIVGAPGEYALFIADPGGYIYTASGNTQSGWGVWSWVAQGQAAPGSPVTALPLSNPSGEFALFIASPAGEVMTTSGSALQGWAPWSSVAQGSTSPGQMIAAVPIITAPGQFAIFTADPNGYIYTASGNAQVGWGEWSWVAQGQAAPGSPVTAIPNSTAPGEFVLFIASPTGEVMTTTGSAQTGWAPWSSVAQGSSSPRQLITAIAIQGSPGEYALFIADPNGYIYTISGNAQGSWGGWNWVAEGQAAAGSPVTAAYLPSNEGGLLALFITRPDGQIYMTTYQDTWQPWTAVPGSSAKPGSLVTAVTLEPDPLALFIAGAQGGVFMASGTYGTTAPVTYDANTAYAAIKELEGQSQIIFPQSSQTVNVGTFDCATAKFTYAVQTGTESYVAGTGGGGGGGGHLPNSEPAFTSRPVTVGYVLVYAMDLQLSFSVVNLSSPFTVTMNGQTATISSGNLATLDLGAFSTPAQSDRQIPGTHVTMSSDAHASGIQLRVLRPPCCTAGAFTAPALPTAIIYAPPVGPENKNFATYSNVTTISNKIATSVSNGNSTKTAAAFTNLDFFDKISGFAGDIVNFISSIAAFGAAPSGGSPGAVQGLVSFLVGTPAQQSSGSAANDLKAIGSGIKLLQDIVDGLASTNTTSNTQLTTTATENDLQTTDTTTLTLNTEPGLAPGVGDRISFLLNVKVAWSIVNNELIFTVLGYDGVRTYAVQTLSSDLALLNSGQPVSQTASQLDAVTLQNLLDLDPLVTNPSASAMAQPRFVQNTPASIGGSGNNTSGDVLTANHTVTTTDITTQTDVSTALKDTKPGWLVALLGSDDNTSTETVATMTYTNGVTQSVGESVIAGVTTFAAANEAPNMIALYFDNLFGTFVFLPYVQDETDPLQRPSIEMAALSTGS